MIDLHMHIIPNIDDGSRSIIESIEMARISYSEGVSAIACTPHIMRGVYDNNGPDIEQRVTVLQSAIAEAGIPMRLVSGADVHVDHDIVGSIRRGAIPTINKSRYILIEPPHHVAPPRLDEFFFDLLACGYIPILTHPERLKWVESKFETMVRLAETGVMMQITAGSLLGDFGPAARYWGEKFVSEGFASILASDAHNIKRRPPKLAAGFRQAVSLVGEAEALRLVYHRPLAILNDSNAVDIAVSRSAPVNKKTNFYRQFRKYMGLRD